MRAIGRAVVLGMEVPDKAGGTILLPETGRRSTNECEVRYIGPKVTKIKVGDIVLKPDLIIVTAKHGENFDVMDGDIPCMVVNERDIRVVLEEAKSTSTVTPFVKQRTHLVEDIIPDGV